MRLWLFVSASIVLLLALATSAGAGSRSSGMGWGNAGSSSFAFGTSQGMVGQGFAFGAPVLQSRPVPQINPFFTGQGTVTIIGPNRFVLAQPFGLQPLPFHCNQPVVLVPFHRHTIGIVQRRFVIVDGQQFVISSPFVFRRPLVDNRHEFAFVPPPGIFAAPPGLDSDWDLPVR